VGRQNGATAMKKSQKFLQILELLAISLPGNRQEKVKHCSQKNHVNVHSIIHNKKRRNNPNIHSLNE
jgi:hypothetical protein